MTCRCPCYCTADAYDGKSFPRAHRAGANHAIMSSMYGALLVLTVALSAALGGITGRMVARRKEWLTVQKSHLQASYDSGPVMTIMEPSGRLWGVLPWRRRKRPDLLSATPAEAYLRGFDSPQAWLRNADLSHAMLSESNLSHCDLGDGLLLRANLSGANLSRSNLGCANLAGSWPVNTNLVEAIVTKAHLATSHTRVGATMPNGSIYVSRPPSEMDALPFGLH
jgi:hypothetical protein